MLTSWSTSTRPVAPNVISNPRGSHVVSSLPTDLNNPPSYSSVKSTIQETPERNGGLGRYHPWEELDDLEYVVGDDERPTPKRVIVVGPR